MFTHIVSAYSEPNPHLGACWPEMGLNFVCELCLGLPFTTHGTGFRHLLVPLVSYQAPKQASTCPAT